MMSILMTGYRLRDISDSAGDRPMDCGHPALFRPTPDRFALAGGYDDTASAVQSIA